MYFEHSIRRASSGEAAEDSVQRIADLYLCTISENGVDHYLSGEILPEMHLTGKDIGFEVEQTLRGIFKQQRIDIAELGRMPLHLIIDHRGNTEAWRLEYKDGWGAAARRLLEKTRAEQRGAWLDM